VNVGSVGIHTAGYGGQTGAELTIGGLSDFEDIKDQILAEVRGRHAKATEGDDAIDTVSIPSTPDDESSEMLGEIRRIRELLEQGRTA
jgi:hypothetical protein